MTDWPANCVLAFPNASLSTCLSYCFFISFYVCVFSKYLWHVYNIQQTKFTYFSLSLSLSREYYLVLNQTQTLQHFLLQKSDTVAHLWHFLILLVLRWQNQFLWLLAKVYIMLTGSGVVKLGWAVLRDPVTDGEECLGKTSCFVWIYILYISNLLSPFELQAFCSVSAALISVRATQHCLPARRRVIARRVKH